MFLGDYDFQKLEDKLLSHSKVPMEQIYKYYIDIFENTHQPEKIYVIQIGNDIKKPLLVLLHGYALNSAGFYKLFQNLSTKFIVACVDLRGFGRSSRPEFKCKGVQEVEDWFIRALEDVFKKMELNKARFYLAGHSIGGYFAAIYALKRPQQIRQLFLISPIGFRDPEYELDIPDLTRDFGFVKKNLVEYLINNFNDGVTLYDVVRSTPLVKMSVVQQFTRQGFRLSEQELEDLEEYMLPIIECQGSGEHCYHQLFNFPMFAKELMTQRIQELNIPSRFLFGENDIMFDPSIIELKQYNPKFSIDIIPNCGHMLILDNPEELTATMLMNIEPDYEAESPIPYL